MAKQVVYTIDVKAPVGDLVNLNAEIDELNKKQKKLVEEGKKNTQEYEQRKQVIKALKDQYSELNKSTQQQVKEQNGLLTSYQKASASLNKMRNELKDMAIAGKEGTKEFKDLQKEVTNLDTRLKKADASAGQFQRNVGNYSSGLKGLGKSFVQAGLSAAGVTAGFTMLFNGVRSAITKMREFEQANANLAAVLGKPRAEITALTEDARRLGAATSFTMIQVSELQTEFAKLGFNEVEILNATEATLNLAAATGSDLATAAAVAGATVRGFGLEASETGRVTDVMAKSFSTTALDMTKFSEAMKYVAPIASASNVSIEETTALLGQLANAGISGSAAGTALRRILGEIASSGKPVGEALKDLAAKGITLANAEDEVGKNAQSALLVLEKSVGSLDELTTAFENAGGSAEKMANEQLNTLDGKLKILESTWDGFLDSIARGDGVMGEFAKDTVDFFTNAIIGLQGIDKNWDLFVNGLKEAKDETKDFLLTYGLLEETKEKVSDVIKKTFEGLSDEQLFGKAARRMNEEINAIPVELYKKKLIDAFMAGGESLEDATILTNYYFKKQIDKYKEAEEAAKKKSDTVVKGNEAEVKSTEKATKEIIGLINNQNALISKLKKEQQEALTQSEIDAIGERIKFEEIALKKLLRTYEYERIEAVKRTNKKIEANLKEVNVAEDPEIEAYTKKEYAKAEFAKQVREDLKNESLNIAQQLADAEFEILQQNNERKKQFEIDQLAIRDEREQDLLQSKLDSNLITQAEYENNRKALAQRTEQERLKIEKDAFEKKKKLDIAQAIINGALAVTKMLAATGPASPPLIAAAVATTAIQVGTIAAQKFKKGGFVNGASHEQGGVPAIVGGKRPIELEGGEIIINKKSASMFKRELSAINEAGGGVPIFRNGGLVPKYASGGFITSNNNATSFDLDRQAQIIIQGINDKKVVNVVSDTVGVYSNSQKIENSVSF